MTGRAYGYANITDKSIGGMNAGQESCSAEDRYIGINAEFME